jgi:hypothetical protein
MNTTIPQMATKTMLPPIDLATWAIWMTRLSSLIVVREKDPASCPDAAAQKLVQRIVVKVLLQVFEVAGLAEDLVPQADARHSEGLHVEDLCRHS